MTFGLRLMYVDDTYFWHALHTRNWCEMFSTGENWVPLHSFSKLNVELPFGYFSLNLEERGI